MSILDFLRKKAFHRGRVCKVEGWLPDGLELPRNGLPCSFVSEIAPLGHYGKGFSIICCTGWRRARKKRR
jgi:hypothetical protein